MANEDLPYPSQVADKYVVRFPDGMRDRIAEAAKNSGRSMNAEIVARLEVSFDAEPKGGSDLMAQLRDLIGRSQVEIWDAKMKAGVLGRLVLTLLITDEIERETGAPVPQQARSRVIEMLEDQSKKAILSAHKTAATWFGATKEVLAKNEVPENSPLRMISTYMGSLEVAWGDAKKDYFLNEYFERPLTTSIPPNTEANLSSATKGSSIRAGSTEPSVHPYESVSDTEPAKPAKSLGLSDASAATGAGSEPLAQRTGLADAAPAKATYAAGAEEVVKSLASKRAKTQK